MRRRDIDFEGLGQAVRSVRTSRGLTQKALGKTVGISPALVWWLEAGQGNRVAEEKVLAVLSLLGLALDGFAGGAEKTGRTGREPDSGAASQRSSSNGENDECAIVTADFRFLASLMGGAEMVDEEDSLSCDGMVERLMKLGLVREVAEEIVKEHPIHEIEMHIDALSFRKTECPTETLVCAITGEWAPPAAYQLVTVRKRCDNASWSRRKDEEREKGELRARIEAYISSLWWSDLAEITKKARGIAEQHRENFMGKERVPISLVNLYVRRLVAELLGL